MILNTGSRPSATGSAEQIAGATTRISSRAGLDFLGGLRGKFYCLGAGLIGYNQDR